MKRMLFVMNPRAGTRKANRYLADILSIFNQGGYTVTVHMTAGPGDGAAAVERLAPGMDVVACCGGDGTLNEVISGLQRCGCDLPIGYIPAGSTNDFANSLKLPTNVPEAARCIVSGQPRPYDIGRFNGQYFSYVASFGAFTRVSYSTPQSLKNTLGHTAYLLESIQELSQLRPIHVRLELDDRVIEDDFLFGAISNSTSVGGILTLHSSQVDLSDGKLELLLIRAPRDLAEISECIWALRTQKYNCNMITFLSTTALRVQTDPNMSWTLDGEQASGSPEVQIENLHHAIRLIQKG